GGATPSGTRQTNLIYGNRENASDDNLDGDDVIVSNGNNDQVFSGGGNDTITSTGVNAVIVGGAGVNLINGTLVVHATDSPDHIVVSQQSGTFFGGGPFSNPSSSAIVVQRIDSTGQTITLRKVPFSSSSSGNAIS